MAAVRSLLRDVERAEAFYVELLGFTVEQEIQLPGRGPGARTTLAPSLDRVLVRLPDQGANELALRSQVVRFLRRMVRPPDQPATEMARVRDIAGAVRSLVRHADQSAPTRFPCSD